MSITLYSYPLCPYSHRCRIAFCEKDMEANIIDININDKPPELALYNPYNQVPVLIDRDLHLYESAIINDYINDRFPHPQLMPTDIIIRARVRLLIHILDTEIFPHLRLLVLKQNMKKQRADEARQQIRDGLIRLEKIFPEPGRFFLDKEVSMIDVAIAPLLWRLNYYQIKLPLRTAQVVHSYAERMFSRPAFIKSLSIAEEAMHS